MVGLGQLRRALRNLLLGLAQFVPGLTPEIGNQHAQLFFGGAECRLDLAQPISLGGQVALGRNAFLLAQQVLVAAHVSALDQATVVLRPDLGNACRLGKRRDYITRGLQFGAPLADRG
ncbi:hypothetical protein D9M71_757100 [compost metagenome]